MEGKHYNDKNGRKFLKDHTVWVPDPEEKSDLWSQAFAGRVDSFRDDHVVVADMDDDYWDVEPERLEIMGD